MFSQKNNKRKKWPFLIGFCCITLLLIIIIAGIVAFIILKPTTPSSTRKYNEKSIFNFRQKYFFFLILNKKHLLIWNWMPRNLEYLRFWSKKRSLIECTSTNFNFSQFETTVKKFLVKYFYIFSIFIAFLSSWTTWKK